MIGLFTPTETSLGFDIREFEFNEKFTPSEFRWLKVNDYLNSLNDLPRFKPHTVCSNEEWVEQFKLYSGWIDLGPLIYLGGQPFRNTEDQTKLF